MKTQLILTFLDIFKEYFAPLLIMLFLAALFAFVLSFLGQKFKVEKNEQLESVCKNLAGINCGGCGYPGCEAYAAALIKGQTSLSKCGPTKNASKAKIAQILGINVCDKGAQRAVVLCNGGKDAADKGGYQGYGDCESANMLANGSKQCDVACMGLNSCIKVCPYDAIDYNEKGVAQINDNCVFCGACIPKCPKGIIGKVPAGKTVYIACSNLCDGKNAKTQCKNACIACDSCIKACKYNAIEVVDNLARINYEKCTQCGKCVNVCPSQCILVNS